jgi:hypothetical protein
METEEYMAKKGFLFGLLLCAFPAFQTGAATVSFLVIETGLGEDSAASRHSLLWESGLLDVFFDAGHIVSNAPVLRLARKPAKDFPDEAQAEFDQALEGGAEFFILALLDYADEEQRPENISLRLYRINPRRKIYEQRYSDKTSRSLQEEFDSLKKAARELVPHLNDR